ncbi:disintegrin and metalloproteinase domain-containing protein 19 isoform X2 [Alligator mississippiensis]|uniref:disintegrin and metalloproteinase domain-containing protein 19 isoform X2 n=1 Tax=Alligator mississippiensis TaxID=8496 RepID=UPI002877B8AA|nr:disintegrin and metalloproteinase domain-containing protein 19 isoform X2 [Alligator mississippiensis]
MPAPTRAAPRPRLCLCLCLRLRLRLLRSLLALLLPLPLAPAARPGETSAAGPEFPHEVVIPQWRALGSLSSTKHPFKAEVKITAEGKDLILDVEKNEHLFAPGYTETHYTPAGVPQTITLNRTDHCFYHGTVRGVGQSSVALSTCTGLRGLIVLSPNLSYVIEPVPESWEQHWVYRLEHLKVPPGSCGYQHAEPTDRRRLQEFVRPLNVTLHRARRAAPEPMKYVELLLVADYAEFQKYHGDLRNRLVEVANYVDKFYKALNIRVALVGLDIWNHRDQCDVSENPFSTLWSFLAWRRKQLARRKHDNAHLITGVQFRGTTVGLAPLMAMCSDFQSGGVNMDHSSSAIGVAATIAHEMGHNFGMNHDSSGCCTARSEDGGCIMGAAIGHPFPRVFNKCNEKELDRYLLSGGGMCLSNMPDTHTLVGGKRCGNGYLEDGEQCDCGEVEECDNPCCNAADCSLKPGAECAHGTCCHQCKLVSSGTLCREISGQCDLPEHCTGKSSFCPLNAYKMDGTDCSGGTAYCYSGMCLTYQQQCLQLWGRGARPAPDLCFERVNAAGDPFGNCGKDMNGQYRKCEARDARCGKIQCQSSASKPVASNAVAIDTTIPVNGRRISCRGTHIYKPTEDEGDILDPGLVMTGTKCGSHHVCFEGTCMNTSMIFEAEGCSKQCHGRGVCNNNKNCHCDSGWAPPDCSHPGKGGSDDSGPLPPKNLVSVIVGVLVFILVVVVVLVIVFCCYKWKEKLTVLKQAIAQSKKPQFSAASAPEQDSRKGHTNPAFKLKTPEEQRKAIGTPAIPPAPPVSPPQPAPEPSINFQPLPAFPPGRSSDTRSSPGPARGVGMKNVPRQPPPKRPPPPAPKLPVPQDTSRPCPPQKALPATPVPAGHRTGPGANAPTAARSPGPRWPPPTEHFCQLVQTATASPAL